MKEMLETKNIGIYIVAVLLGGGSGALNTFVADPRPDPFTGTEGKSFEKRVNSLEIRFAVSENNVARMQIDIDKCLAATHPR